MAESSAKMLRVALLLLSIGCISAKRFSVMAPNVFHIGVKEKVSVSVFDANNPVTVKLYLQDYPNRAKTFSQVQGVVRQGSNIFLPVKVEPQDLPDPTSVDKQYVYLVAKSDDAHFQFHKEAIILLSYKDGMIFIQTDKPIYTPKQTVKFRVIPLGFDMKPSQKRVTVVVQNPQGVRVQQWKDLDTSTGFISKSLKLGDFTLLGNWNITAVYGHQNIHNTSVQFEVREYVLPKYSVKLAMPPYILKTDRSVKVNITTRYTYDKPVRGLAAVTFSITGFNGNVTKFGTLSVALGGEKGVTIVKQKLQIIQDMGLWFPEGSRLQVDVDVIETATGTKETATDNSCQFTSSPYVIKFKNTPKYFKPGLRFVVKVEVTYPNKNPAANVPMRITAEGKENDKTQKLKREDQDPNARDLTDEHGRAEFVVDACLRCQVIIIKIKTDNQKLDDGQNAEADLVVKPFDSEGGPLIMARQLTPGKVGRKIQCESYRSNNNAAAKLSFAVVSRGRILSHNTTEPFDGMFKSWSLRVTREMSPSARLISYYIDNNNRVVADSVLLNIEDRLPTEVEFPDAFEIQPDNTVIQHNKITKLPGTQYSLRVEAPQGTRLGLLGVDQSVYLLRNKNRLTPDRIFETAEELDLGCGVGGGKNSGDIFKNAGVVLMTETFVSTDKREDYGCKDAADRKKRSAGDDKTDATMLKACCELGERNVSKTCFKRKLDAIRAGQDEACRSALLICCIKKFGLQDTGMLGRSGLDLLDFGPSDAEILDQTQVRSYFPETWIYDEKVVGPGGLVQMDVTIPDSITTWVMQAVAINNKTGLGLPTPLRIVAYQDFFITLTLPYSVKKGEQVSVLATVFNYHGQDMRAKLFLKGNRHFCSTARDGEHVAIGTLQIPAHDAKSVAVPIVPKKIGEIEVEVSATLQMKLQGSYINSAGDAVKRKLLVVPEGAERRKTQSFILDPSENLNDAPKKGEGKPAVKPTKAPFESNRQIGPNGQLDSIKLQIPRNAIPGSVGAAVYLTGNLLGPVVNTTIEGGLEKFFRQPTGCGEQNMIYLAPNVYVLEYLMNTRQLSGANEENAYRFIQSGYERELNYRRNDMSFSAFGNRRPGSTWLTAFVMRVFCKAKEFAGVNIDEEMVCGSVAWLIQNQRADGALPEVSAVIHKEMVGGVYTEGDVSMTAFVLSALAECSCTSVNSAAAVMRARNYLENQYNGLNKPYSMALTAYALSLVDSPQKTQANDRLIQHAIYDKAKKSRYWNAGGNALNVETAGYALLAQLKLGRTGYSGPIVTYLTNQRQGGVGFVSTQDTVVALQALAAYSDGTAGNSLDLRVKLTAEMDPQWKPPEIHITSDNALLRREIDAKNYLGGLLFVESRGTGVGLLEVEVRYNVPSSRNETCNFVVRTEVKEIKEDKEGNKVDIFGPVQREEEDVDNNSGGAKNNKKKGKGKKDKKKKGKGCKKPENKHKKRCRKPPKNEAVKSIQLKVCTRYKGDENTGMSMIDIGILTGFKPDMKSLNKLSELPEYDKHEVSDASLVIYLEEIPWDRDICVVVEFTREHYVGVVQAVPVNVYDYYEPDRSCSVFYGPDKSSPLSLGVCEVGDKSCKCSQDECTQPDPPIGNIGKLINLACNDYNYVIKAKVLLVDEQNAMLTYVVEVVRIMQQGINDLVDGQQFEFKKRGACQSPDLKANEEYLFMGRDKGGEYNLDKTSFVKLWPKDKKDNNRVILDDFASQYRC